MTWIIQNWPFIYGQQQAIFSFTGMSIVGLVTVNVFSALRQGMPIQKILSGLFVQVPTNNKVEKIVHALLIVWLVLGFMTLVLDVQINGMQLVDSKWAGQR